ncbi:MAG TPA: DsbA family protein [Alphaproteobacteria bacterium]|jgi:protein-disulfide isomerase|nr:DsbA family protein [Alphaproteobacteria bacterium]
MRNLWILVGLAILVMVGGTLAWREWGRAQSASETVAEGPAQGLPMDISAEDKILGSADAPVTIIEYASLTCPHCASFHRETLPKLKSDWIDTGKVRLVFRDFPLDGAALSAAALAHCAPADQYFPLVNLIFERQREWAIEGEWRDRLTEIAAIAGMDQATVDGCLADETRKDAIVKRAEEGQAKYDIQSTPSFIINGRKVTGAQPIDALVEIIREVQPNS